MQVLADARLLAIADFQNFALEPVPLGGVFGNADPIMEPTRIACENVLGPLLAEGTVPVVTGCMSLMYVMLLALMAMMPRLVRSAR